MWKRVRLKSILYEFWPCYAYEAKTCKLSSFGLHSQIMFFLLWIEIKTNIRKNVNNLPFSLVTICPFLLFFCLPHLFPSIPLPLPFLISTSPPPSTLQPLKWMSEHTYFGLGCRSMWSSFPPSFPFCRVFTLPPPFFFIFRTSPYTQI